MDIHPPHHAAHSVREFLLQILTVTCGIVIALSLEGLIVWHNDANLARVTREDFRAEMTGNMNAIDSLRPANAGDFKWMGEMIGYGEARLHNKAGKPPALLTRRAFHTLSKSAWDTALATQAIHHLRFQEARTLAEAYDAQAALNDLTDHAEHQWIAMASFGGNLDELDPSEARAALASLRISAAYTGSMLATEEKVVDRYKAALAELGH